MLGHPVPEEKYHNTHKQIFSLLRKKHDLSQAFSFALSLTTKAALFLGSVCVFNKDTSNNVLWLPISLSLIQDIFQDAAEIISLHSVEKARDQLIIDSEQHSDEENQELVQLGDLNNDIELYRKFSKFEYKGAVLYIAPCFIIDIILYAKNIEAPRNQWVLYTIGAYFLFRGLVDTSKGIFLQEYKDHYQNRLYALSRNRQPPANESPNAALLNQGANRNIEYGSFRP